MGPAGAGVGRIGSGFRSDGWRLGDNLAVALGGVRDADGPYDAADTELTRARLQNGMVGAPNIQLSVRVDTPGPNTVRPLCARAALRPPARAQRKHRACLRGARRFDRRRRRMPAGAGDADDICDSAGERGSGASCVLRPASCVLRLASCVFLRCSGRSMPGRPAPRLAARTYTRAHARRQAAGRVRTGPPSCPSLRGHCVCPDHGLAQATTDARTSTSPSPARVPDAHHGACARADARAGTGAWRRVPGAPQRFLAFANPSALRLCCSPIWRAVRMRHQARAWEARVCACVRARRGPGAGGRSLSVIVPRTDGPGHHSCSDLRAPQEPAGRRLATQRSGRTMCLGGCAKKAEGRGPNRVASEDGADAGAVRSAKAAARASGPCTPYLRAACSVQRARPGARAATPSPRCRAGPVIPRQSAPRACAPCCPPARAQGTVGARKDVAKPPCGAWLCIEGCVQHRGDDGRERSGSTLTLAPGPEFADRAHGRFAQMRGGPLEAGLMRPGSSLQRHSRASHKRGKGGRRTSANVERSGMSELRGDLGQWQNESRNGGFEKDTEMSR
ncbi:hypothetical protein CERSUDRAFT_75591 [Gelatoporia subvermispora B]|uniref:Uncharacterized protein n=1 Tax=Ceriporiopsis subvermispora (strain B) TaxID=914234 RepID=M2QR36_CERS8|nr:hypothetical protein CERSUDRAFT_75591 [Gelatoporia subvermispora B]